jgi:tetratricopeptide (TPR) repeat protein
MDGAYQMLGQPENAVHDRLALEIYEQLGRTRTVATIESNLGVQAYSEGRWDEAIAWYRRAQEHSLESGDLRGSAVAGVNLAEVLVSRGAYDEAEAILPDARRVLRAAGRIPFALLAEMQQTRIMIESGELERAVEALSRIFDEARGIDHSGAILEAGIYYAHALARVGAAESGLVHLTLAASTAGDEVAYYAAPLARAEATCLLALNRLVEARERIDIAVAEAERQQMLYKQLLALRTRAEIIVWMDDDVPPEELREANRLAQLLGLSG